MANVLPSIDASTAEWIAAQHVFFVASAPSEGGHVNLSPKGHDTLRVIDEHTVAYLDLTGSGVETIAHSRQNGRVTIMWCAFQGPPNILRLFGVGTPHPAGTARYAELITRFPALPGARAVIELAVDRVQTSCGFAVPFMEYQGERPTLQQWTARKDDDQLAAYRAEKNATSIDGLPGLDP